MTQQPPAPPYPLRAPRVPDLAQDFQNTIPASEISVANAHASPGAHSILGPTETLLNRLHPQATETLGYPQPPTPPCHESCKTGLHPYDTIVRAALKRRQGTNFPIISTNSFDHQRWQHPRHLYQQATRRDLPPPFQD